MDDSASLPGVGASGSVKVACCEISCFETTWTSMVMIARCRANWFLVGTLTLGVVIAAKYLNVGHDVANSAAGRLLAPQHSIPTAVRL